MTQHEITRSLPLLNAAGELTEPGYADAWPYRKDAEEFARHICDNRGSRYATSPAYLSQILSLIRSVRKICAPK